MLSAGDCRERGERDWALAQELAAQGLYNWATTVAFYAALHHLNALLVEAGEFSDDLDHPVRQVLLRKLHPAMESRYAAMMGKSIRTRYEVAFVASADFYAFQVKHLEEVRDYVTRSLERRIPRV